MLRHPNQEQASARPVVAMAWPCLVGGYSFGLDTGSANSASDAQITRKLGTPEKGSQGG